MYQVSSEENPTDPFINPLSIEKNDGHGRPLAWDKIVIWCNSLVISLSYYETFFPVWIVSILMVI